IRKRPIRRGPIKLEVSLAGRTRSRKGIVGLNSGAQMGLLRADVAQRSDDVTGHAAFHAEVPRLNVSAAHCVAREVCDIRTRVRLGKLGSGGWSDNGWNALLPRSEIRKGIRGVELARDRAGPLCITESEERRRLDSDTVAASNHHV